MIWYFLGQAKENNFERTDPNRIHSSNWSMQVIASSMDLSWTFHFCLTPPWLTIQHPLLWKPGEKGQEMPSDAMDLWKEGLCRFAWGGTRHIGRKHFMANRWKSWFSLSSGQMVRCKNDLTVNPKNSSFFVFFAAAAEAQSFTSKAILWLLTRCLHRK